MSEIKWGENTHEESKPVKLNKIEMNTKYRVEFQDLRQLENDYIVATVNSEPLEGNTLWLRGKFGLQNGALSLIKLVGSSESEDFVGKTFTVEKIESVKSMSGYRYQWTL